MPQLFTDLVVVATERLTPGMVRLRFRAVDAEAFRSAFRESRFTDRYVKLVFRLDDPADGQVLRTYTVLEPDLDAATVTIDFVVHGTDGVAGPWAAAAQPGDRITVRGPGGAYAPDPAADWHLLAGDEAGLPAIRAALAALPRDAVGHAVVEAYAPEHRQPDLADVAPPGVEVSWIVGGSLTHHALDDATGAEPALLAAVRALPWREGRVHAFVHGEAQVVMHGIRPYLLKERGVPRADASISGYWRRGRTEESFRQWKQELASVEQ